MIEQSFTGRVKRTGNEDCDLEIGVTLSYEAEFNPYGVQLILSNPGDQDVVWTVDRGLMTRGSRSYTVLGQGDVRFRFLGSEDGGVLVCLRNLTGHADIWLPVLEVIDFLNNTMIECPMGQEKSDEAVEDLLKELFQ